MIAVPRTLFWGTMDITLEKCKQLHLNLNYKPYEGKNQNFDLQANGVTKFKMYVQGMFTESNHCTGANTWEYGDKTLEGQIVGMFSNMMSIFKTEINQIFDCGKKKLCVG